MSRTDSKVHLLALGLRGMGVAHRVTNTAAAFADGFALGLLSEDARTQLTAKVYAHKGTSQESNLFDWERVWFESVLPPTPSTILVGGAGDGREVRWLHEQGYSAIGFDPVANSNGDAQLLQASYEELAIGKASVLDPIQDKGPYNAIILGWGSFTHVSSAEARVKLLGRLRELCDGPVLMSFWSTAGMGRPGRAKSVGFKFARFFGSGAEADLGADCVHSHTGYCHRFSRDELLKLAQGAGYEIRFGESLHYPHATLVPKQIA